MGKTAAALDRDPERLLAAHAIKFAELARAIGTPDGFYRNDMSTALAAMFPARDYSVAPLDRDAVRLEAMSGGRLVRVRLTDGTAPIKMSGGGEVMQILPMFTRTSRGWVLVR